MKKKIGLYFGSFNPIHIGHMAIAEYIVEFTDMTEIWFIVSPQNPFKLRKYLLPERDRLHLVNLAINNDSRFKASDIEFALEKPNYTCNTLAILQEKFQDIEFSLIIGGDNLEFLHKWRNYKYILENYSLYVYKRLNHVITEYSEKYNITVLDAPKMEISSSFIRNSIKEGKIIKHYIPQLAAKYISEMNFYK